MNRSQPHTECSRTDAVLARHLDGDLDEMGLGDGQLGDGYAFASADLLHEHLRHCEPCQTALRRARRLDAALAQAVGGELAVHAQRRGATLPELERRWLAGVAAALAQPASAPLPAPTAAQQHQLQRYHLQQHRPQPSQQQPSTRRWQRAPQFVLVPITLLASCVLLLLTLHSSPPPTTVTSTTVTSTTVASATPVSPTVELPADALRRWSKRAPPAPIEQRATPPLHELQRRVGDERLHASDRLVSARQLLTAAAPLGGQHSAALVLLVEALAGCGDTTPAAQQVHGELLDLLRNSPHTTGALRSELHALATPDQPLGRTELAFVVVGARLGTPLLDASLRRLVRRHHAAAPLVATALRGAMRPHPAALLLDLWHDLAALGVLADDEHTAAAWFTDQAPAMFEDLMVELRDSRDGPRRRRCLLALGCAADGRTVSTLLAQLQGPHVEEAHLAAFAIACLPRAVLQTLLDAAAMPDAFLLRAALLRADLPAARRWLAGLGQPARGLPYATLTRFLADAATMRDSSAFAD